MQKNAYIKEVNILKKLVQFFVGVKKEIGKIRWPKKKEMMTYSAATLFFLLVFGIFFAGLDFILSALKQVVA